MLAKANRMSSSEEFAFTTKNGAKANSGSLTGFLVKTLNHQPPRFGFIVSKKIGGSVTRHRVTRQLRHLAAPWVEKTPDSSLVVVRPNRYTTSYHEDFDALLTKLLKERASQP